jgi:glyoxylase-like metal-dependent hydrolase (beta-lactamase superfamily II)
MKNSLFIVAILVLISTQSGISQTIGNFYRALEILEKSKAIMGVNDSSLCFKAKGTIYNMGHYEIPEIVKNVPLEETYAFFPREDAAYLFSEIQSRGKTNKRISVLKADSIYEQTYFNKKLTKTGSQNYLFEMAKVLPTQVLMLAFKNRQSLRYLGTYSAYHLLSFNYNVNENATIFIDQESYLLEKVQTLGYSSIYGDVIFETTYKKFSEKDGMKIPTMRVDSAHGQLERELSYSDFRFSVRLDSNNFDLNILPENVKNKLGNSIDKNEQLEFTSIASNIDLVKINSQDNKVLIASFADHISLFEVPQGIELNTQLLNELSKRYHGKQLHYLFVTHHHPDHAGGIKAFANLPARLVTTKGNEAYFKKLLSARHSLSGGMDSGVNKMVMEFIPLNGQKRFKDNLNEVIAYEIGVNTSHTNEHVVYYFPKAKLLWTGDLLYLDEKGTIYPVGPRGKAVLDLIESQKLVVDKIYTSWPLHGQKDYGTVDFLKKLVNAH